MRENMNEVTKSIIRTVIEQAINRYDNSRNKEEIIDELSSVFESSTQYYEEHWEEKEVENEYLSLKVDDLYDKMSVRAIRCLQKLCSYKNIETVGDLAQLSQQELLKMKNLGRKTVNEIKIVLSEMGLSLNMVMR
jgi:DNA-directed RNA polymerase subunit alpha